MTSNTCHNFLLERIHFPGTIILDEPGKTYTCGRGKENQIQCISLTVSRQHCSFFRNDHEIYVIDLGSSNGLFVNEIKQKARHMVKLNDNDIIGIGCPNADNTNNDMFIYKLRFIVKNQTLTDGKYITMPEISICKNALTESTDKYCHSLSEHNVNRSSDLIASNEVSELSKNVNNSCQIKTLNKKVDNRTNKVNSNEEIELIDTCAEINTIKQDTSHLDTNNDNKSQRKNDISIHKNLSEVNSAENPLIQKDVLNKTNEFQPIKEDEVICIDLANNIDTEIVQENDDDNIKNTCTNKRTYHTNNAVYINDIDDTSIHKDMSNNIKISQQRDHSENVKIRNEVHDNLKEQNESLIKENTLNKPEDGPINIVYNGDYFIKMEDEIIITDDDEETIKNNVKDSNNYTESTIKLKQIKQEPKLRFSEIDIVNLSDDEENVFPSSQLFDSNVDVNSGVKKEIKREYNDNHDEDVNRLDDTEIIISDSEDEDNIWLHRLSRSQLLNDTILSNDKKNHTIETVKDEPTGTEIIDKDIQNTIKRSNENINDTSNQLSVSIKNNRDNEIKEHKKNEEKNIEKKYKNSEQFKNSDKLDMVKEHDPDISLDTRKKEIDNLSNQVQESNNKISHSLNKKQNMINNDTNDRALKQTLHSKEIKLNTRKRPQLIDAPYMPVRKRKRQQSIYNMDSKRTEENLKEYLDLKEQKQDKCASTNYLPSDKLKKLPLSKEEKKKLVENRKNKLKKIAAEDKKVTKIGPLKPSFSKPKAKVSLKSRSDFLIDEIRSKTVLNKPSIKKSLENKQCQNNTVNIDTRKDDDVLPSISALKIKKKIPNYKETLNNVTKHLQQSLSITDVNSAQLNKINESHSNVNKLENIENVTNETIHTTKDKNIEAITTCDLKDEVKIKKNVKMQKENRSPNRQAINQLEKQEKNVSFNNVLEIHEYEIEPQNILKKLMGKDAPIPVDKLSSKRSVDTNGPKLEQFLLRIFLWNPIWLEEQQRLKRMPPILKENELHPMLTYYKSYNDYYKIAEPLLLLEIWYGITREFEMIEKNTKRPTMMCSIVEKSFKNIHVATGNIHLSSLIVQVLVTKENLSKQAHPNYGDLVVFEYEKGKHIFQKVFAYVTSMHQSIITSFTEYNKDLEKYVKRPYALLTYTIMTRNVEENFIINRIQRIRTVTYLRSNIRMIQAIQYLPQSPLINLILYPKVEAFQLPLIEVHNRQLTTKDKLNQKQLEAVGRVTGAVIQKEPKICLIQGPPGTGKSKVIVNIITEILYGNNRYQNSKSALRILVCAPSNAAIDEIVLRLLAIRATIKQNRFKMVRIGKPETMHLTVKDISLTELGKRDVKRMTTNYASKNIPIESFEEEKKLLEARINGLKCEIANSQNIDDIYRKHLKLKLIDMSTKYELLENHKSMNEMNNKELAKFQRVAERRILECADIITCTLSSCYTNQMESIFGGNKEKISVCIVDEATQSCEAENLIPLLLGVNTLVLVGDPNQLPATIISQQAKRFGLDQSLFSRVQNAFLKLKNNPIIMLTTQYRMTYAISYFPNKYFYGGKLKNEVEHIQAFPMYSYRVFNINSNQNNDKFSNTNEAEFISNIILCIMNNFNLHKGKTNISIGILTPYNNQKYLILEKVNEKISNVSESIQKRFTVEINTVDSFQGQERDIILMSCVRSHGIGFLSDPQRLCVALTRAKHSLILCGNFNTFMRDQMWNALISDSKLRKIYYNINSNASLNEIKQYIIK
ncbi:helicase sen1 [Vespa crabro]|uniref:helicase sen1 n=1 Tax=Vespa crabro TaxID=7445 RepID=UPI001F028B9C|nr:helicase sen1 [Vespa crabro]